MLERRTTKELSPENSKLFLGNTSITAVLDPIVGISGLTGRETLGGVGGISVAHGIRNLYRVLGIYVQEGLVLMFH